MDISDGNSRVGSAVQKRGFPPLGWIPLGLTLAGLLALPVDVPLAKGLLAGYGQSLHRLLGLSEVFAHGVGVVLILAALYTLDPARRAALPRIAAASLGAGGLSNLLKLLVTRTRPQHLELSLGATVRDTFGEFFPPLGTSSSLQSFPSAHAATAAGLAVVLVWLYPRGWLLFPALALLAAAQRVETGAHYLSDALFGAAFGAFFALLVTGNTLLGRCFDRFEAYQNPR